MKRAMLFIVFYISNSVFSMDEEKQGQNQKQKKVIVDCIKTPETLKEICVSYVALYIQKFSGTDAYTNLEAGCKQLVEDKVTLYKDLLKSFPKTFAYLKCIEPCPISIEVVADNKKYRAVANIDGTVDIQEIATANTIATLTGHGDWAKSACMISDIIAVSSATDNTIRLWDVTTKKEIAIFSCSDFDIKIHGIAVSFDHKNLVISLADGSYRTISLEHILNVYNKTHTLVNVMWIEKRLLEQEKEETKK
ncbi:hypothetical protein KC460_03100 [Candidatus Dependentiae bacterium]|nr:hypothetical protein [Candidatus Dependentiae bacterium]